MASLAGGVLPVLAGVTGVPVCPDESLPSAPGEDTLIAQEQWVSPHMVPSFETSFDLVYKAAADGRLMRQAGPGEEMATEDVDFGKHRWPQIQRAIRWARSLARTGAPSLANALMPQLKAVFVSEGVPPELVWIAEVESRMDPGAESASGARGLFQFMPVTAERFGLLTDELDERTIPEKSARAAAQYLAFLYRRFGDWHLALAGYNAGEGCVGRLLRKHHATTFEEIIPYLPAQTQDYVPRVMATLALRENVRLGALPSPTPATPTWN